MELRHILFKEICFLISLYNGPTYFNCKRMLFEKEEYKNNILPFQSMPNLHFPKLL